MQRASEMPVILHLLLTEGSMGVCFKIIVFCCLENPMDGGAWQAAVREVAEGQMSERFHFHFSLSCIGEGNGNPLQCSCLENPRDGGAWWAAVAGVAQSWTRLKRLSSSSSRRILVYMFQDKYFQHLWNTQHSKYFASIQIDRQIDRYEGTDIV